MMYNVAELFHRCAFDIEYKQVGDSVNYAFEENAMTHSLIIYFQGSNSISDWVRNFLFAKKPYKDMDISYRVHRGFLAAWKTVEDIIIAKILEKDVDLQCYKWKSITVAGYSHGGALAGFCHECVWYHRPDLRRQGLVGYGFEAPRFYAGFRVKTLLKQRWEHFYVVRNRNDIVTHCPPVIFGYAHVGHLLKIGKNIDTRTYHKPHCVGAHYPDKVYESLVNEIRRD